jgi:hypothetical protein
MTKTQANLIGFAAFVFALIIAGFVLSGGKDLSATKTTMVTTPAVPEVAGTTTKTTAVKKAAGQVTETTTTTERQPATPATPEQVTTTAETAAPTFLERALGDGGINVMRLGVILLLAFLAAALIQRVALGNYQVKLGTFELAAVATDAADAASAAATKVRTDLEKKLAEQGAQEAQADALTKERLIATIEELQRLQGRVDRLKSDNSLR